MTGDLTGDLSSKRGHLTGTQPRGPGVMAITGQVPLAELDGYQSRLKSLTAGQGSYSIASRITRRCRRRRSSNSSRSTRSSTRSRQA
jgi:translation elongation factor EF-G